MKHAWPIALRLIGCILALSTALAVIPSAPARAQPALEGPRVATLPPAGDHWVWVPDRLLEHSILYDGDSGGVLGMIDSASTLTPKAPVLSRGRGEFYSADVAYSRGLRGDRIDFVSIYDSQTLAYKDEVMLPNRMGESNASLQYAELLGERFFAIYNQFPLTSVSIVDVAERKYVGDISITGCAGIYPVSERRFATLCGNGSAVLVELDESGDLLRYVPSASFFDVVKDPMAISAGRAGTQWTFVSFEGKVRGIDFGGDEPALGPEWSLVDEAETRAGWRPGGLQFVALHAALQRLYVVMHQGGPGSHKAPGLEIWVYDLAARKRIERFEIPNLTASFLASFMKVPTESWTYSLLSWVVPPQGVHAITVSQDAAPLLFARSAELGSVAVIDARTGETLRFLTEAGLAGPTLRVP